MVKPDPKSRSVKSREPKRNKAADNVTPPPAGDIGAFARQFAPAAFRELEKMANDGLSQTTRDAAKAMLHNYRHVIKKLGK
jgi:hypothetical protein